MDRVACNGTQETNKETIKTRILNTETWLENEGRRLTNQRHYGTAVGEWKQGN